MFPVTLTIVAVIAAVYLRGWFHLLSAPSRPIQAWHAATFLFGLCAIWLALASRIAAHEHHSLTVHMIQHLVIMSIAAPLILLGQPLYVLAHGLPLRVTCSAREVVARANAEAEASALPAGPSRLRAWCWIAATAALVVWHVPAALTLTMQSNAWHAIAMASFVVTGLLFWWPVVQPWPSVPEPRWSIVLYLFLAMLPCDVLAAFLVFSERIAYSVYLSMPGHTSLSVLDDQQVAGAVMWTVVTLVYLTAGTILATRLLSPRVLEAV